jgi:hypothetical protein
VFKGGKVLKGGKEMDLKASKVPMGMLQVLCIT